MYGSEKKRIRAESIDTCLPMMERHEKENGLFFIRFEKSLILSLLCLILLFMCSKRFSIGKRKLVITLSAMTHVDIIPMTTQGGSMKRPPNLPKLPIPVEDEYIPEDETIELTNLDLTVDFDYNVRGFGQSSLPARLTRPLVDAWPDYPEEERKQGITGIVELEILVNPQGTVERIRVVKNTTGSKELERAAADAARRTRYAAAGSRDDHISIWIRRSYSFNQ